MNMEIWKAGPANCLNCGREWVAVWPLGADGLVCPTCHGQDTEREASNNAPTCHEQYERLDECGREEWFEVCKSLKPGLEYDEFLGMWGEFIKLKEQGRRH